MEVLVNETLEYNVSLDNNSDVSYTYSYCSMEFSQFWYRIEKVVLNLNLVLCLFGVLSNALNFIVFTRSGMRNSTNWLLAGIAVSDLVVMATYVPQYVAKLDHVRTDFPYYTAVSWIVHEYFLAVFHHISIWLTVTVALWRYIAVIHPLQSRSLLTKTRAGIIVAVIVVFNLLITIPGYLDAYITEADETKTWKDGGCGAKYCAEFKPLNFLRKTEFWYQVLSKIVPAVFLTYVTIRLIMVLVMVNSARKVMGLKTRTGVSVNMSSGGGAERKQSTTTTAKGIQELDKTSQEFERTTKMLVVVLVLFQVTEVPPSVVYILELFYGKVFYYECRRPVHYPILTMYYLSGAFNFFVYLILSRNYRRALASVLGFPQAEESSRRTNFYSQATEMSSSV